MDDEKKKLYVWAIQEFGHTAQMNMVAEECSELIKVMMKMQRSKIPEDLELKLIDEMADVKIMLEQIEVMFPHMQLHQKVTSQIKLKNKKLKEKLETFTAADPCWQIRTLEWIPKNPGEKFNRDNHGHYFQLIEFRFRNNCGSRYLLRDPIKLIERQRTTIRDLNLKKAEQVKTIQHNAQAISMLKQEKAVLQQSLDYAHETLLLLEKERTEYYKKLRFQEDRIKNSIEKIRGLVKRYFNFTSETLEGTGYVWKINDTVTNDFPNEFLDCLEKYLVEIELKAGPQIGGDDD